MGATGSIQKKPAGDRPEDDVFEELKNKQFSYEAALPKIKSVCEDLAKFDTARMAAVTPALKFLSTFTSASTYGSELARLWGEKLVQNKFIEISVQLWPSFWKPTDFIKVLWGHST